jgi:peptidoglycan/LPS O-acetylase OafA/YrhL
VVSHSPFNFGEDPLSFTKNGYLFVDFFFILSGFVMSYAYGEKIRNGMPFLNYISLRLGRLYPLHLFMLLAWVPYILLKQYLYESGFGGSDQSDRSNLFSFVTNLLLIHSMGIHSAHSWNYPSWSISTEFFAYVLFYVLILTLDKGRTLRVPLVISILCYTFLFSLGRDNFDITYDFGFIRCVAAYYLGVFLFRLRPMVMPTNTLRFVGPLELISAGLVLGAVTYANVGNLFIAFTVLTFAIALLVFSSSNNGYLGKFLETKFMRHLGIWSYSIYMVHALVSAGVSNVFEYVLKFNLSEPLAYMSILVNLSVLAITIYISKHTYQYVEKRFRDLVKSKVLQHDQSAAAVAKAPAE